MKVITVSSLKGGIGKSAISVFLSLALAKRNKKVLAIDLDGQSSLTDFYMRTVPVDEIMAGNSFHVLSERKTAEEVIAKGVIDIIPASPELHKISSEMAGDPGAILRFRKEIRTLKYDFIIIDTPPSLSYELRAGLHAADLVLSPVNFDRWAFQGIALLLNELEKIKKNGIKQQLKIVPAIVTESEMASVRDSLPGMTITATSISKTAAVRTSIAKGTPLKEESKSEIEFDELAKEVL